MAKVPIQKFSFRILVFSVVLAAVSVLCQLLLPAKFISPALPFIVLFFTVLTLLTSYIVMRKNADSKKFVSSYLLSRMIKMFSFLLFVTLYMILNPEDRWAFAGGFIIIYFAYAVFELYLLKNND